MYFILNNAAAFPYSMFFQRQNICSALLILIFENYTYTNVTS